MAAILAVGYDRNPLSPSARPCQDQLMISAIGVRIVWSQLPQHVRDACEEIVGDRVVETTSQAGGFSPGTADRVVTASGRRAFVKAVGASLNTHSVELARQEIRVTRTLPETSPAPGFIGSFDDGDWVAIVLEDIDGRHPRTPWVEDEIDATVTALRELARTLTPSPMTDAPRASDRLGHDLRGWSRLAAEPPVDLDPWVRAHLDSLSAAAESGVAALAEGDTLTHCDIRADNLLVRPDGRIIVVDWPWGCIGPDWLDRVLLAANVIVHGGDAGRVLAGIDPRHAADVITALAGYFMWQYRQPAPPSLPTVRAFQRAQGEALLPWLRKQGVV
jgi:aminoglycoside phosphotransferase (APT) family kinase protein